MRIRADPDPHHYRLTITYLFLDNTCCLNRPLESHPLTLLQQHILSSGPCCEYTQGLFKIQVQNEQTLSCQIQIRIFFTGNVVLYLFTITNS